MALPYTLPGSRSHRLAVQLATEAAYWKRSWPQLGKPLLQLVISSLFALSLAAQLGKTSLALTILSLAMAFATGPIRARRASNPLITPLVPLTLAWLLGQTAYGIIGPVSVVVAAAFASTLSACVPRQGGMEYLQPRERTSQRTSIPVWQVLSQMVVVASLVLIRQPVVAATVALLVAPQLLLVPLLSSQDDSVKSQDQYFGQIQLPVLLSMILTALALGYRS